MSTASAAQPSATAWDISLHRILGLVYALVLPFGTAPKEIAFAALGVCAIVRWRAHAPTVRDILLDRLSMLLAVWAAWTAASVLWSAHPEQGWEQVRPVRFLLTGLVLLPVAPQRGLLMAAFLIGVHLQNLIQLGQGLGIPGMPPPDPAGRLPGSVGSITLATLCGIAMCWHLASVLGRTGRSRWLGAAGFAVAAAGLVFTGSRGPWIAVAAVIPLQILWMSWRWREARLPAVVFVTVCAAGAAASWPVTGPMVSARVQRVLDDLELAERGRYGTDVGFRIESWKYALSAWTHRPLHGYGSGSFHIEDEIEWDQSTTLDAHHAHSVFIQALYTTGLVGFGLLTVAIGGYVVRCLKRHDLLTVGVGFGIVMWCACGQFDTYQITGNNFAVLLLLLALAPLPREPESEG